MAMAPMSQGGPPVLLAPWRMADTSSTTCNRVV